MPNLSIYKSGYRNFKNTLCLQNRPRGSAHCRPWRWRPQSWRDEGHCRESGRRRSQSRGIESQHPTGASRAEIPTWWCVWHRCGWAHGNAWCWRWVFGVYHTINTTVNKLNVFMYVLYFVWEDWALIQYKKPAFRHRDSHWHQPVVRSPCLYDYHYKRKIIVLLSYLYNRNFFSGKTTFDIDSGLWCLLHEIC